jgi:hypothetical protein
MHDTKYFSSTNNQSQLSWIKLQNDRGTTRTCLNYPAVGSGHSEIHQDSVRSLLQVFGRSYGQQHQLAAADQVATVNYQEEPPGDGSIALSLEPSKLCTTTANIRIANYRKN